MLNEQSVTTNPCIPKFFRGKIKVLTLTTSPGFFPEGPEIGDEWEQKLSISSVGNVRLKREIVVGGDWFTDLQKQTVTEKRKITTEDTAKIFDRIGKYFSVYHEPNIVCDGDTWELKLTNTDGETFCFIESTCYDHRSALSRVTKLIRKITGLEYLLGFDAYERMNTSMRKVCANCKNEYIRGDKYCRYCGAPMGKPTYIKENFACIYGPPPIKRTHTCAKCGYSWETYEMVDLERWCPKCGGSAPATGEEE